VFELDSDKIDFNEIEFKELIIVRIDYKCVFGLTGTKLILNKIKFKESSIVRIDYEIK